MKIEELATRVTPNRLKLSEHEIGAFESSTGYSFPEDYRSFLSKTCGGGEVSLGSLEYLEFKKSKVTFSPSVFCSPGTGEYHHIRPLQRHFGDLEHSVADVPEGIFTIADDMMGNFLTIDLRPESLGQIAVVNHETVGKNFCGPETYEILAVSFSEFVKNCKIKREKHSFVIDGDSETLLLDSGEIGTLVQRAHRLAKAARLTDHNNRDRWIEFRPESMGGYVFKSGHLPLTIWQTYYPGDKKANPDIIELDDVTQLFKYFLGGIYLNLEVRARQVK